MSLGENEKNQLTKISTQEADELETLDKHEELNYDRVVGSGSLSVVRSGKVTMKIDIDDKHPQLFTR